MQDQVAAAVTADASFKEEMQALVAQFEEQKKAFQPNVQVQVGKRGVGAVGDGATAVGERGVYVKGDAKGSITTGDQTKGRKKKKR